MNEQNNTQIVGELSSDIFKNLKAAHSNFTTLLSLISSYSEILKDLISTKKQYVEIIKKYADNLDSTVNPSFFTGVVAAAPKYSSSEMKLDSQALEQMGHVVEELEHQKQMVYSQIQQIVQAGTRSLADATSTSSQMEMFLNQAIQASSGPNNTYGSASMLHNVGIL